MIFSVGGIPRSDLVVDSVTVNHVNDVDVGFAFVSAKEFM